MAEGVRAVGLLFRQARPDDGDDRRERVGEIVHGVEDDRDRSRLVPMAAFMAESSMFPTTPTMDARTMSAPRLWAPSVAEAFSRSV